MSNFFFVVLAASFYASVAALVILLLKNVLKQKLNAQWHYLIWAILIVRLLIPFAPQSSFSFFNVVPEITQLHSVEILTPILGQNESSPEISGKTNPQEVASSVVLRHYLPYVWILGIIIMLLWLSVTYWLLRRNLKTNSIPTDSRMLLLLKQCQAQMGVIRHIQLVTQTVVNSPSLFGVIHPKILISPEMTGIGDKEMRYILMHELGHYKRKDIFINHVLLVLQIVHWFNPLIWYCFKRIRADMEVATDECVLSVLASTEHRAYGHTLLAILERFHTPTLAPKLLGMVDDKKNIERRIRMIKMSHYFQTKKTSVMLVGLLCLALLSGILLTNGLTNKDTESGVDGVPVYDAEALIRHKTPYVGDSSKVSNLVGVLPFAEYREGLSLQTREAPYGATVNYNFITFELSEQDIERTLRNNAMIMFALIDNVDNLTFYAKGIREHPYRYQRAQLEIDQDLREYAKNGVELQRLLSNF